MQTSQQHDTITEPERRIPVIADADVCVLGGSCTGVFAAVRAARMGSRVVLVERQNAFGGVACSGLVNVWHSLLDTEHRDRIIAGLTVEIIDRLEARHAVRRLAGNAHAGFRLNTAELKIELDALVMEHGIAPFLHTTYCRPMVDDDVVTAVLVESKNGRGAIRARVFIDATGDGDLAFHLGIPRLPTPFLQPPTTCANIRDFPSSTFRELYRQHHQAFGLVEDAGWDGPIPGLPDLRMVAQTHVFGVDCSDADDLTRAEIEGRRQTRAVMDLLRTHADADGLALAGLASHIGIRETRRFRTDHVLSEDEILHGTRFPDAVANGSYRVDVHHKEGGGFLFKYLDGTTLDIRDGGQHIQGRWREPIAADPVFYQVPYRCLVRSDWPNLLLAGRMIGADHAAFGAVRVMVNLNQVGEAAGVAAHLTAQDACTVHNIAPERLRDALREGGSITL